MHWEQVEQNECMNEAGKEEERDLPLFLFGPFTFSSLLLRGRT